MVRRPSKHGGLYKVAGRLDDARMGLPTGPFSDHDHHAARLVQDPRVRSLVGRTRRPSRPRGLRICGSLGSMEDQVETDLAFRYQADKAETLNASGHVARSRTTNNAASRQ